MFTDCLLPEIFLSNLTNVSTISQPYTNKTITNTKTKPNANNITVKCHEKSQIYLLDIIDGLPKKTNIHTDKNTKYVTTIHRLYYVAYTHLYLFPPHQEDA